MSENQCRKMAVRKPDRNEYADDLFYSETMKRAVMDMLDEGFELKRERAILPPKADTQEWVKVGFAVSTIDGVYFTKGGKVIIRASRFSPSLGEMVKEIWSLTPAEYERAEEEKEAEA